MEEISVRRRHVNGWCAIVLLLLAWSVPSALAATGGIPLAAQGNVPDTLLELAGRALLENRHEEVVRLLGPLPDTALTPRALAMLGTSYGALNDPDRALRRLRAAVERDTANTGYRFQLARMLSAAGYTREAETQHSIILRQDPGFLPSLSSLGLAASERKDYPAALVRFRAVVARNPRDYLALYYLGHSFASMDSIDSARTFLAASLALNNRYSPALELLASLYYRVSDYRQALRLYRNGSREFPEHAEYWYHQGLCLEKFDDWHGARDCYRRAIELDSTSSLTFAHLGQVYFELQRFDSSAMAYEQTVRLDEENPVLFLNLGLAYARGKQMQRAESAFKNAIAAQDPEQVAKVYTQLGALYFVWERIRDARDAYRKALLFQPGNLEALFYVAVAQDRLKNFPAASEAYRKYLGLAENERSQADRVAIARERAKQLRR